jgi:hypothetical protein
MFMERIQELSHQRKQRRPSPQEWAAAVPGSRTDPETAAGHDTAADPETAISAACTGVSIWDGFVPDPVPPGAAAP